MRTTEDKNDRSSKRQAYKYIIKGYGASGSKEGRKLYKKAVRHIIRAYKYSNRSFDSHWKEQDIEMSWYYDELKDKELKAAETLLPQAIECGNDMALMQYAFLCLVKNQGNFSWRWRTMSEKEMIDTVSGILKSTERAYEAGFAPAAYMLSMIYRDGYGIIEADADKYEHYFSEFERLRVSDERQAAISVKLPKLHYEDKTMQQLDFFSWEYWLL